MAIFLTRNSLSTFVPMFLTFFFFFNKVNSTKSLSFSYTYFLDQQPDLIFQGDATVSPIKHLQLNNQTSKSMGRVLYATPFQIWNSKTGNVASFTTSFSFLIERHTPNVLADGFAFFLAPVDTQPKKPCEFLGLFDDNGSSPSNQIVAIEFDTYHNGYDPQGQHIGIDVNSITSVKTIPWDFEFTLGDVTISYDGLTKELTATLVYGFTTQQSRIISSVIDVKTVLPEYVRFGFSASNGCDPSFDNILHVDYWSFESTVPLGTNAAAAAAALSNITRSGLEDSMI